MSDLKDMLQNEKMKAITLKKPLPCEPISAHNMLQVASSHEGHETPGPRRLP